MKLVSASLVLESKDCISINILNSGCMISVDNNSIMVTNDQEERIYYIRSTKHGGFELVEGTLL